MPTSNIPTIRPLSTMTQARAWNADDVVTTNTTTYGSRGSTKVRHYEKTWQRTIGYKDIIRGKQRLPDHPFSLFTWEKNGSLVSFGTTSFHPTTGKMTTFNNTVDDPAYWASMVEPPPLTTQVELVQKLVKKQRGEAVNHPVAILEARKTASMVTSRAIDLVNLLRALRRGDVGRFLDGLKEAVSGPDRRRSVKIFNKQYGVDPSRAAANIWLEYQYGWTPFMNDVHNSFNVLTELTEQPFAQDGRTRVKVFRGSNEPYLADPALTANNPRLLQREVVRREWRRAVWHWYPVLGYWPAKFGALNPATIAWELIPFSFIADWFLPIGDYLAQMDTDYRINHRGGTYGFKQHTSYIQVAMPKQSSQTARYHAGGTASVEITRVVQTPIQSVPFFGIGDILLSPKIGAARAISAIALLRTNLKYLRV